MKHLLIIGARGFGREVFHLATQCAGYLKDYTVKGFLDDKPNALDGFLGYPSVIGSVESYAIQRDDIFVCALGDPKFKKHYVELILSKGGCFHSLIHPTASVSSNTCLGRGVIILPSVFVSCEVRLADFVTIQPLCIIGHDAKIGDFAHLNAYSFVGGDAKLGEGVTLHTGAKVLPHKMVGAWATVGAGSVVLHNVKPGRTVFGMPAMACV